MTCSAGPDREQQDFITLCNVLGVACDFVTKFFLGGYLLHYVEESLWAEEST